MIPLLFFSLSSTAKTSFALLSMISILLMGLWLWALISAITGSNPNKALWIIVILFVPGGLGAIIYLIFGRRSINDSKPAWQELGKASINTEDLQTSADKNSQSNSQEIMPRPMNRILSVMIAVFILIFVMVAAWLVISSSSLSTSGPGPYDSSTNILGSAIYLVILLGTGYFLYKYLIKRK